MTYYLTKKEGFSHGSPSLFTCILANGALIHRWTVEYHFDIGCKANELVTRMVYLLMSSRIYYLFLYILK